MCSGVGPGLQVQLSTLQHSGDQPWRKHSETAGKGENCSILSEIHQDRQDALCLYLSDKKYASLHSREKKWGGHRAPLLEPRQLAGARCPVIPLPKFCSVSPEAQASPKLFKFAVKARGPGGGEGQRASQTRSNLARRDCCCPHARGHLGTTAARPTYSKKSTS